MTTKFAGTVMSARLGLTLESTYAASLGDSVMVGPGDYQCSFVDGTRPIIGYVTMPNVKRGTGALAGTYPQANTPGDVTVDLKAHFVRQYVSGATNFVAGTEVGLDATGKLVPYTGAANTQQLGIALMGSVAAGTTVDVAVN